MNAAQYFQTADHIVVLGDHGIKEQGPWQDIKIKATLIAKFSSKPQASNNHVLSSGFDKLGAQVRAKDEAAFDLARTTGDFALYGTVLVPFTDENLRLIENRLLFRLLWCHQPLSLRSLHVFVFDLHHHISILASAVDTIRQWAYSVLYFRFFVPIAYVLDHYERHYVVSFSSILCQLLRLNI
jgi:hypothetical protein